MVKEELIGKALSLFDRANIVLTAQERNNVKVSDFGLNRLEDIGVQLVEYVSTQRVSAKDVVLMPAQTVPEHKHPTVNGELGKEETFRCRYGQVLLYVEGETSKNCRAVISEDLLDSFTIWHEIILNPGQQYTIKPDTLHWFQGGPSGAIMSEFATQGTDDIDVFTMKNLKF